MQHISETFSSETHLARIWKENGQFSFANGRGVLSHFLCIKFNSGGSPTVEQEIRTSFNPECSKELVGFRRHWNSYQEDPLELIECFEQYNDDNDSLTITQRIKLEGFSLLPMKGR